MKANTKLRKNRQHILKSSGYLESFSARKFQRSLERTGLRPKYCKEITKKITEKIKPGTSTQDIYKHTYQLLNKHSPIAATHYSLKRALLDLGPTGFEFEYFVSKYFETIGYNTFVDIILQGEFVRHEVDIVASKSNYQVYVECKFHNNIGSKNDIKTALYIKARWEDLKNGPDGKYLREYFVASNTAFTQDAIAYANGTGLQLLGVNAPEDESFLDKIKKFKLYPITSLKRLKKNHCQQLLQKKIILCKDLLDSKNLLQKIGINENEILLLENDIRKMIE